MSPHDLTSAGIVSRDEWLVARKELLTWEKELTRLRDELNAKHLALPWVKVEKRMPSHGSGHYIALLEGERHEEGALLLRSLCDVNYFGRLATIKMAGWVG